MSGISNHPIDGGKEILSESPALNSHHLRQRWGLLLLTLGTFFLLLGSRALNEPDEGRYAEIAREMLESGDWLAPHFWYLPHFDKPPLTYWAVAASMKLFGQNEWAVRLPVALAALSGVWAAGLLACSIGGRRAGVWAVLILQTSLLFFVMARMLTTDIFLAQFVAWAIYFFWRSWLCLRAPVSGAPSNGFWPWHLAGWAAVALGFLVKGPLAMVIPAAAMSLPVVLRWKALPRKGVLFAGILCGLVLFFIVAAPWFLAVNQHVPHTLDYMIFHQAAGHVTGSTIRNRRGFPFYFFAILAVGLLPWSWLLGCLWRRAFWRSLPEMQKDAWLMLYTWAIFTFTLFSVTHSKLPAYILPIFPALAVMLAIRFFSESPGKENAAPGWVWQLCAASALLLPVVFGLAMPKIFHVNFPGWMKAQAPAAIVMIVIIFWLARRWDHARQAAVTVGLGIFSLLVVAAESSRFETDFKTNQTLKPLGAALRENYRDGDAVVCWKMLPEGLPFYSHGVISPANRPFFAGMNQTRVPFEFTGNVERARDLILPDASLVQLLASGQRVIVVTERKFVDDLERTAPKTPLRLMAQSGEWELLSNQ